jgi:hypothetical protein
MRKAATSDSPFPSASKSYVASLAVLADLEKRDAELRDLELARMAKGEKVEAEEAQSIAATQAAAEALLRGDALPSIRRKRPFLDLLRERAAIRLALEIGRSTADQLRLKAAGERLAERAEDLQAVGRQLCLQIIELDRVLRARDALVSEIAMPPGTLPLESWPLAGRLSNTASQAYRLCEVGVANGWLSAKELADEYETAKRADIWR